MPPTFHERALVPDTSRSRLLAVVGDRPSLPLWTLVDPEPVASLREGRARFGIESPFLRLVRLEGNPVAGEDARTILEFDAAAPTWRPGAGLAWLPFENANEDRLDAGPFAADVVRWTADLRSGEVPELRAAWARPGWHEATSAWVIAELERLGRTVSGPVEQLGSWAISSLLGIDTNGGRAIVKSVPPLFGHEPELTRALASEHEGHVPAVLAIDPVRRHLVMQAFGGAPLGSEEPGRWADGLVELADIQKSWIGRRDEAARIRVEDRSLAALEAELDSIVTDERASPGLAPAQRERLVANLPLYRDLIGRLQAGPVPETLIHGDFHPWNVQREDGRILIYDWSDASWGHPFFDVRTTTVRTSDEAAREQMCAAYLGTWREFGDPASLRNALDWAAPLSELHVSISWRRIAAVFEPGAFPFVDDGVQRHLEAALAATDGIG